MTQQLSEHSYTRRSTARADGAVILLATGLAALARTLFTQVTEVDLAARAGSGTTHVGLLSVVVTALVVALAATGLLRVLERRTKSARRIWTVIAVVVWAMSFAGPLGAITVRAGLGLACLHLLVGASIICCLRRIHPGDAPA